MKRKLRNGGGDRKDGWIKIMKVNIIGKIEKGGLEGVERDWKKKDRIEMKREWGEIERMRNWKMEGDVGVDEENGRSRDKIKNEDGRKFKIEGWKREISIILNKMVWVWSWVFKGDSYKGEYNWSSWRN